MKYSEKYPLNTRHGLVHRFHARCRRSKRRKGIDPVARDEFGDSRRERRDVAVGERAHRSRQRLRLEQQQTRRLRRHEPNVYRIETREQKLHPHQPSDDFLRRVLQQLGRAMQ